MSYQKKIENLRRIKRQITESPDPETKKRLFLDRGMFPPRERLRKLLDEGSFFETDLLATHNYQDFGMNGRSIPADGVITGYGMIHGRRVAVYAQDFSAMGGTYGEMTGRKICALMDKAAEIGIPVIGICHSGGLRLHETLGPMEMFGQLFKRNSIYSGFIPQISIILGVVAGGQAYSPGLTDFILMTKSSSIFIAGPAFVKAQTSMDISEQDLGGAEMHARSNNLVDVMTETEEDIFDETRRLVDFLPLNCRETPPTRDCGDDPQRLCPELDQSVPVESNRSVDMKKILLSVFDNHDFFETKTNFAKNIITGFARLDGRVVGVVANQPKYLGGVIDIMAAEKSARFVRFCDAFNIPLVTFQDSPAYLIGKEMESEGIIYRGAKLLYAYAEATVPKITVIVRKAYAGSYIALGSQYIGADFVYAWPGAEISSVAAKTAASILFREKIAKADDPDAVEREMSEEYYRKYVQPYRAASLRHINDIIEPGQTRSVLVKSLKILSGKREKRPAKKHGNIPL